jgi:hypothetical protein
MGIFAGVVIAFCRHPKKYSSYFLAVLSRLAASGCNGVSIQAESALNFDVVKQHRRKQRSRYTMLP